MGLRSETRREDAGRLQAKQHRHLKKALASDSIFGEYLRCHTSDIPRLAGTAARLHWRVSCFWVFVVPLIRPDDKLDLNVEPVNEH